MGTYHDAHGNEYYDAPDLPGDVSAPEVMYNALKVITESKTISNWLVDMDPKALHQAVAAVKTYEESTTTATWVDVEDECFSKAGEPMICATHEARFSPEYTRCDEWDALQGDDEALYAVGVYDGSRGALKRHDSAQYDLGYTVGEERGSNGLAPAGWEPDEAL